MVTVEEVRRTVSGPRWEHRMLRWLEYPMNLAFTNLAWLVCSLPVVTWFTAAVAMTHSLDRWQRDGDGRVFGNFAQGWRLHWRRTLPIGGVSTLVLAVLVVNSNFLLMRSSPAAFLLLAGTVPLLTTWLLLHLSLIPLIVLRPELPLRRWLAVSFGLSFGHPVAMLTMLLFCVLLAGVLLGLPTLFPFFSASLVALLSLRLVHRYLPT